jgi:hypothetical protein
MVLLGEINPRPRPFAWLSTTMEEIYDSCLETELAFADKNRPLKPFKYSHMLPVEVKKDIETRNPEAMGTGQHDVTDDPLVVMPFITYTYLWHTYGLPHMVDQAAVDLLFNVEVLLPHFPEVMLRYLPGIFCAGISLLTDVLYWNILSDGIFCTGISVLTAILYWNILTDGIFSTGIWFGIFLLTAILYWNILTDGMFCTGISLLTEYFVLESTFRCKISLYGSQPVVKSLRNVLHRCKIPLSPKCFRCCTM